MPARGSSHHDDEQLLSKVRGSLNRGVDSLKKFAGRGGLIDKTAPHFSGITRWGVSRLSSFWNDPFHTLLNLPWGTFIFVFFCTYLLQYVAFAFLYWMQGSCVIVDPSAHDGRNTFVTSLWMSSRVASTLGFSEIKPNPDCGFVNVSVMLQVIFSSLINFILLGVVFARFSAPFKRASTVRFSKVATVARHPSGFWALTMRVANLRKHQILQPSIRLMVTAADSITPSLYHHEQLAIEGCYKQLANLELGFPAHITHVITPDSFLYNLSLLEMDTRMMEVLVFVDGIDAMTSRYMSARIAYNTSDIYMNEQFANMNLEMRGKKLGLDFNDFDRTVPALDPALLLDLNEAAGGAGGYNNGTGGLWQLRHQTFRRLAERYAHLGVSHTAVVAAAAAAGVNGAAPSGSAGGGGGGVHDEAHEDGGRPLSNTHSAGGEISLLGGTPQSHLPAGASLMHTTSGMPFAVTKASAQEQERNRLAALFSKQASQGPHGAWVAPHADSQGASQASSNGGTRGGAPSGGGAGAGAGNTFVELQGFQHGAGSAWQQSSIPLSPMPVLGSPPVGLGHHSHAADGPVSGGGSPSYAGRAGTSSTQAFNSPLLANSNLYSLDEEGPAVNTTLPLGQQQRVGAAPALPTSHNPL